MFLQSNKNTIAIEKVGAPSASNSASIRRTVVRLMRLMLPMTLAWSGLAHAQPAAAEITVDPAAAMQEVRTSLTIGGKPLPPELFRDMGDADLADNRPVVIGVDVLAAMASSRYADAVEKRGSWYVQKSQAGDSNGAHLAGVTSSGLLTVVTWYANGGPNVYYTLHLMKLTIDTAYDNDRQPYKRLVMNSVQATTLGDRWDGQVTVSGNTIAVQTATAQPAKRGLHLRKPPPANKVMKFDAPPAE